MFTVFVCLALLFERRTGIPEIVEFDPCAVVVLVGIQERLV